MATTGSDKPALAQQRKAALLGAALTGDPEVAVLATKSLKDEWVIVREAAVETLRIIPAVSAVDALIDVMRNDSSPEVRCGAGMALAAIGDLRALMPLLQFSWDEPQHQEWIADAIVEIGRPAVPQLISLLSHPEIQFRLHAIVALGRIGDRAAVRPLLDAANDHQPLLRAHVAEALKLLEDTKATPALCMLLADDDPGVRANSAAALLTLRDPRCTKVLANAMFDEHFEVRLPIVRLAGVLKDTSLVPMLIARLSDVTPEVRQAAVESLGQMKAADAIDDLSLCTDDHDQNVRLAVAEALGMISDERIVPPLLILIEDACDRVRMRCCLALAEFMQPNVVTALSARLRTDRASAVRQAAAKALGRLRDTAALPALKEAFNDEFIVRCAACIAVGEIRTAAGFDLVAPLLGDPACEIRHHAAIALGNIGDPRAIKILELRIDDPDVLVRRGVAKALKLLGDSRGEALLKALQDISAKPREVHHLANNVVTANPRHGFSLRNFTIGKLTEVLAPNILAGAVSQIPRKIWMGAGAGAGTVILIMVLGWTFSQVSGSAAVDDALERGKTLQAAYAGGTSVFVSTQHGRLEKYDTKTGDFSVVSRELGGAERLLYSPEAKVMAASMADGQIQLLDSATGAPVRKLEGLSQPASAMVFGRDGKSLWAVAGTRLVTWDVSTGTSQYQLELPSGATAIGLSPETNRVALGTLKGVVQIKDIPSLDDFGSIRGHQKGAICGIGFSADGRHMATASNDGTLIVWDMQKRHIHRKFTNISNSPSTIIFSVNGKRLLLAGATLLLQELDDDQTPPRAFSTDFENSITAASFSEDEKQVLLTGTQEWQALVVDIATGAIAQRLGPD